MATPYPRRESATSDQDSNNSNHNGTQLPSKRTSNASQNIPFPNLLPEAGERAQERARHLRLVRELHPGQPGGSDVRRRLQEIEVAPLFSNTVRYASEDADIGAGHGPAPDLPQYGFLGLREATFGPAGTQERLPDEEIRDQDMIYANVNAPWSAFICGSQGGGKSHTLSCLLENALLSPSKTGALPNPLAGILFHYDKFTSFESTQICEAAYLCSQGIPVRILVSPSNLGDMKKLYADLPQLAADAPRPKVFPLRLNPKQLNVTSMMTLMCVNDGSTTPLYLGVLYQILRDMATQKGSNSGINYREFRRRLDAQDFTKAQAAPLEMRLQLLEALLDVPKAKGVGSARTEDIWNFEPGSLTIVDLSCPFVNENDACALFTICLGLFLQKRGSVGRIVALDEAHKVTESVYTSDDAANSWQFLTQSGEATKFTDQLTSIICQQRHLATRVLIATQEPTLSPRLLDLCNVTIVHRFLSPAWFEILRSHLAGAREAKRNKDDKSAASDEIFRTIVGLKTGEALVFCPAAMLDVRETGAEAPRPRFEVQELREAYIKMRMRDRVTADGGKSIMASDNASFGSTGGGSSLRPDSQ